MDKAKTKRAELPECDECREMRRILNQTSHFGSIIGCCSTSCRNSLFLE
jgi:hypothetical protein